MFRHAAAVRASMPSHAGRAAPLARSRESRSDDRPVSTPGPTIRPVLSTMQAASPPALLQRMSASLFSRPGAPSAFGADRQHRSGREAAALGHAAGCACSSCSAPSAIESTTHDLAASHAGGAVIQRTCEMGHPFHADGPCPFELGHRPRRQGGGGGFRSIYTTPPTERTGMDNLYHASQEIEQSHGFGYLGPTDVLHAPTTPIRSSVPTRVSSHTATAFQRGTGHSSAREHMEAFGHPTDQGSYHRTHAGAYSNHGPPADDASNIAAATSAANGMMIAPEHHYPSGFHDLTEIEVGEGSHVAHRIHQAIAHPDAPTIPLFRDSISGFQPSMTPEQWDQRQAWSRNTLTAPNLNAAHALQQLNPHQWPTMDQLRDREDTERTATALSGLRHDRRGHVEDDHHMDTGDDGDRSGHDDDDEHMG